MKPIQLNKQQIEAILNGATMLCMPISEDDVVWLHDTDFQHEEEIYPLQIGEKYYVQEEIDCIGDCNIGLPCQTCGSSQGIGKALADTNIRIKPTDIQIKRVQELTFEENIALKIKLSETQNTFIDWFNEQYPKQPYEDNPYVFLPKLERI